MTTMNAKLLKDFQNRAESALAQVAKEMGISATFGRGSYDPVGGNATLKLELALISDDGTVQTREAQDWKRHAVLRGFDEDDLGKTFRSNGRDFTIAGYKPRSRKRPVLARAADGKMYVFPVGTVLMLLKDLTPAEASRKAAGI